MESRWELGIGRKAAWFLLHRLRKTAEARQGLLSGPHSPPVDFGPPRGVISSRAG